MIESHMSSRDMSLFQARPGLGFEQEVFALDGKLKKSYGILFHGDGSGMSSPEANKERDPNKELPLTPARYHILLALGEGQLHGYSIMDEVTKISKGLVTVGPATTYRSLEDLVKEGIIQASHEKPRDGKNDYRREYYKLTAYGKKVTTAESERLANLVEQAKLRGFLSSDQTPE